MEEESGVGREGKDTETETGKAMGEGRGGGSFTVMIATQFDELLLYGLEDRRKGIEGGLVGRVRWA